MPVPDQFDQFSASIIPNASLSKYRTFQLGGPCLGLIECQRPAELQQCVTSLSENDLPFILIGGGSNIVVSDEGLDCHVIRYYSATPIIERDANELIVTGSTLLDDLAKFAAESSLSGLNYTSGIPGTVGGAIVGNAGAFGQQIGDVVKEVTLISRSGQMRKVPPSDLQFTYRYSNLRESNDIVVGCVLSCQAGNSGDLLSEREEILATRRSRHPDLSVDPCAGSFFRNIEPTSKAGKRQAAGWFLDQAEVKSLSCGGARIFPEHANIIIKSDGCKAADVRELSLKMAEAVKEKFQLDLIREVRFVGSFEDIPDNVDSMIW